MKVRFIGADYDAKFRNIGGHVLLKGILDDRFSPYRKEFLWGVIRQGYKARSYPGSRDNRFCDFGHIRFSLFVFRFFLENSIIR
jgi:hypothetical protein